MSNKKVIDYKVYFDELDKIYVCAIDIGNDCVLEYYHTDEDLLMDMVTNRLGVKYYAVS